MRLIDADALIEEMRNSKYIINDGAYTRGANAVIDYYVREIPYRPTIDPEELRPKGEWIWNEENECWVCSNCEMSALNNYRGNSTDSNYCPNCGAKMEVKSNG